MLEKFFTKEAPLLGLLGLGGGIARAGAAAGPLLVSGGNSYFEDSTYSWYVFTSPGNLVVADQSRGSALTGLVVGGGGGGGADGPSRERTTGGGGGVVFFEVPADDFTATTYPVTVGSGGGHAPNMESDNYPGGYSQFTKSGVYSVRGNGGGAGASYTKRPQAAPGGSGGGADPGPYTPNTGGSATQPGANPGVPWVKQQWGTPGGQPGPGGSGNYGGNPGFAGVPTPIHPDFQSTSVSALPPYYSPTGISYGRRDTNGLQSPGGNGVVIVRTLLRTGPA